MVSISELRSDNPRFRWSLPTTWRCHVVRLCRQAKKVWGKENGDELMCSRKMVGRINELRKSSRIQDARIRQEA